MQEQGQAVPALENRPEIPERMLVYMEYFGDLQLSRRFSNGVPLPLSDVQIYMYLSIYGLGDKERIIHEIKKCDTAWFVVESASMKKKSKEQIRRTPKRKSGKGLGRGVPVGGPSQNPQFPPR